MKSRDGNKGDCCQACRFEYTVTNKDYDMQIYEDERGTYIMNSKDLCMIQHIPELIKAGITSFKIEGRMKSAYYVALVTRAYREAIDDYLKDPMLYESKKDYYLEEVRKTSHRQFFTGFYHGKPEEGQNINENGYTNERNFIGVIKDYNPETKIALVEQRNKFSIGEEIEIIRAGDTSFTQKVELLKDMQDNHLESAPHPKQMLYLKMDNQVKLFDIICK